MKRLRSWDLVFSFLVLAEEMQHASAAERLGVSRQTLARRIERLEEDLGVPLLVRSGRRVELTPAGVSLRESTLPIAESMRQMTEQVRLQHPDRWLAVGISVGFGARWVRPVEEWVHRREHPAVLEHRPSEVAISLVRSEELDLVLYTGDAEDPADSLVVGHEAAVVLFPESHPAAAENAVRTGDLLGLPVAVSDAVDVERRRKTVEQIHGDPDLPYLVAPRIGTAIPGLIVAARTHGAAAIVLADGLERHDTSGLAALPMDPPLTIPVTLERRPGLPDEPFRGLGDHLIGLPSRP